MATAIDWLMLALLLARVWLVYVWRRYQHARSHYGAVTAIGQRLLRLRTPNDCPVCR